MNKKGFTLVELLATITIIGMLSTILITVVVKKINETKEQSRQTMINSIELAAKNYAMDNESSIDSLKSYDYAYIPLKILIENDLLTDSLIDQTTNKALPMTDTVYVTRFFNGTIRAVYDIDQAIHTKITLNGSFNVYIKKENIFTDPGVIAISSSGNDVSSSVITTGTVDTNTVGNYIITYTYDDISITRNVIVYQ